MECRGAIRDQEIRVAHHPLTTQWLAGHQQGNKIAPKRDKQLSAIDWWISPQTVTDVPLSFLVRKLSRCHTSFRFRISLRVTVVTA